MFTQVLILNVKSFDVVIHTILALLAGEIHVMYSGNMTLSNNDAIKQYAVMFFILNLFFCFLNVNQKTSIKHSRICCHS